MEHDLAAGRGAVLHETAAQRAASSSRGLIFSRISYDDDVDFRVSLGLGLKAL